MKAHTISVRDLAQGGTRDQSSKKPRRQSVYVLAFLISAGALVVADTAKADLTNSRPVVPRVGSERTLQQILDDVLAPPIDAVNDQSSAAVFTNVGDESTATMIIEIAGFRNENTFGIYSYLDAGNTATIFDGQAAAGDTATITFKANGDVTVSYDSTVNTYSGVFAGSGTPMFGFFITTPEGNTFYTEDSLNIGHNPQALIYQGDDRTTVDLSDVPPQTFGSDDFIIAFEDLVYARGDQDFNDLVVMVEGIAPVPAPAAVWLGVVGVALVGGVRKRLF